MANRFRLLWVAAALLLLSVWLLWTLVLGEPYIEFDRNGTIETAIAIAIPAIAGLIVAAFGLRRLRRQ